MAAASGATGSTLVRILRAAHRMLYALWLVLLAARVTLLIILLCLVAFDMLVVRAHAQSSDRAPMSAKERAYTLTVMCSVVAQGDSEIQKTSDALRKMAKAMGYSSKRVAHDATGMASVIGRELRTDPDATNKHREICQKLQLLG